MNTTHKQMIEEEINSLQGELHSLARQKQGFLMGTYADWSSAMQPAKDRGWKVKTYGGTDYHLIKMGEMSITINFNKDYTQAICTSNGQTTTMRTPEELEAYINIHTADSDDDE
jgi:hypothetical protein